jgi:hypothetical protein
MIVLGKHDTKELQKTAILGGHAGRHTWESANGQVQSVCLGK